MRQLELLALLKARPDLKGIWEDEIIPPPPAPPATLHLFAFFFLTNNVITKNGPVIFPRLDWLSGGVS